jgi:hypothetical protein
MGLDISFNKEKAMSAGMKFSIEPNGDEEDLERAKDDPDPGYIAWLKDSTLFYKIDTYPYYRDCYEYDGNITTKAGRIYKILTKFLTDNNITWDEF